jgi:signal transduction histidine kinase
MNSLRRRLTVSYTVLVGAFISIIAIVLTWLAFDAVIQPIKDAIVADQREAREIAAAEPFTPIGTLVTRLRSAVGRSDVLIFAQTRPFFGGPGGGSTGAAARPRVGPMSPPGDGGEPGGPGGPPPQASQQNGPPPDGRFSPPDVFGGGVFPRVDVSGLLNIRPAFVRLGNSQAIVITPDRLGLLERARAYLLVLLGELVLAFVVSWLIARWIAAQAVAPLIAVTAELQRFAAGDFTPRELARGGTSDVGELISAYNGAAAQVAAAFDERERGEARMRRFLADAGHGLRTPLSIVTAYLEVLRKGGVDDSRVRERAFETLGAETVRMRRLVDRLVALARLESPETTQPVVVDLGAIARDAITVVVAARGGDVQSDIESGAFVLADPGDLHEAITNLVDNALKYGDGSTVNVSVTHERGSVAIRVTDHGPGIPEVDRDKIFERFYRSVLQQTIEGSGLGLAIAKRAAARAGGALDLERTGAGETVFTIRLPLHVEGALA